MNLYNQIFKRKSFHKFKCCEKLSVEELDEINDYISSLKPLDDTIKTEIIIVPESDTTSRRGAEYYALFYSEKKDNYLRNIGYMGEQLDLYLASKDIGSLWYGIGKPNKSFSNSLEYVIMIGFGKVQKELFREDMYKSKRKKLDEIWVGEILEFANIVRFAPSACNSQPWMVNNDENTITIYRNRKAARVGIIPIDKVAYYNRVDIGIFMCFLEICFEQYGYSFTCEQFVENEPNSITKVLVGKYHYKKDINY